MSVVYIQHPPGYPETTYSVVRLMSGRYAVEEDHWDTPTSHTGPRRWSTTFRRRSEAERAIEEAQHPGHKGQYDDEYAY